MNSGIKNFEEWNEYMYRKYGTEDRYEGGNPLRVWITKRRINFIFRYLNPREKDIILDLGCGAGMMLKEIDAYSKLIGIDISETAIKEANENLKDKDNVILIKRDIQKPISLDYKIDKIICSEVLEHLPYPERVIDNIYNLASEDTLIIITIPNERLINKIDAIFKFLGLNKILKNIQIKLEWHLHEFDLEVFKKIVKNKLEIVDVKKSPSTFFVTSYVILCKKL